MDASSRSRSRNQGPNRSPANCRSRSGFSAFERLPQAQISVSRVRPISSRFSLRSPSGQSMYRRPIRLNMLPGTFRGPLYERRGLFIGTREFEVLSRNHLLALSAARTFSVPITVINPDGKSGRQRLQALKFPEDQLTVAAPLPYPKYLRLIAGHRLVLQFDQSSVPGQVAGDSLLCRIPTVGGNGAVERLAFPELHGSGRTFDQLVELARRLLTRRSVLQRTDDRRWKGVRPRISPLRKVSNRFHAAFQGLLERVYRLQVSSSKSMTRQTHANQFPLKELSLNAIVELLRANGMRITKNRIHIIDTLLRAEKPLSLDEIQARTGEDAGAPGLCHGLPGDDGSGAPPRRPESESEPFLQLLRASQPAAALRPYHLHRMRTRDSDDRFLSGRKSGAQNRKAIRIFGYPPFTGVFWEVS